MILKDKLKAARKLLNLTQTEMAKGIGVPQKVISLIESGKRDHIPTEYFYFLIENNIDLNKLFLKDGSVEFIKESNTTFDKKKKDSKDATPSKIDTLENSIEQLKCTVDFIKLYLKIDDDLHNVDNTKETSINLEKKK